MSEVEKSRHARSRAVAEIICAAAGAALLLGAWLANADWFDRHFFPDMFTPRPKQMFLLSVGRSLAALLGLALLVLVRPWVGCIFGQLGVGSSRVDLQACKLEYSIVSPK